MEAYEDPYRAGLGSLLTATSYQIAVGMYSYFLTNMLGLILIYSSLTFLFKAFKSKTKIPLLFAIILGCLLDLTHPWTFDQYLAASALLLIILLIRLWKRGENRTEFKNLLIYVSSLVIFDFIRISLLRYGGIYATATAAKRTAALSRFWFSSIFSFRLLYGGYLSTLVPLILAIIAIYLHEENLWITYWRAFIFTTSIIFITGDATIKSRLIYNIPIGILAAMGLGILEKLTEKRLRWAITCFTILNNITYLFRSLANLV